MSQPACYMGIGHDGSATAAEIEVLVMQCLQLAGKETTDLAALASIEVKAGAGLIDGLGSRLGLKVFYFSAAQLEAETPRLANPSEAVFQALGCHGVAEAAALAAAGADAVLIVPKTKSAAATCAIARRGPLEG